VISAFDPNHDLILVGASLWGPNGRQALRFALDTGATETVVSVDRLAGLGYGWSAAQESTRLITGSAIEYAPRVVLQRLAALGQERLGFPVLAYYVPPEIGVASKIGLDFLRSLKLTLDFRAAQIELM